jgi:hypothetical protein
MPTDCRNFIWSDAGNPLARSAMFAARFPIAPQDFTFLIQITN